MFNIFNTHSEQQKFPCKQNRYEAAVIFCSTNLHFLYPAEKSSTNYNVLQCIINTMYKYEVHFQLKRLSIFHM